jgi:hypothetical protein
MAWPNFSGIACELWQKGTTMLFSLLLVMKIDLILQHSNTKWNYRTLFPLLSTRIELKFHSFACREDFQRQNREGNMELGHRLRTFKLAINMHVAVQ